MNNISWPATEDSKKSDPKKVAQKLKKDLLWGIWKDLKISDDKFEHIKKEAFSFDIDSQIK